MRNKIINGAMMIDQRYAGSSTTLSNYIVDRWVFNYSSGTMTSQQSTQAPSGFYNSLSETVTSVGTRNAADQFLIYQNIEGFNIADLNFGSSAALTITLSFWVRSSVSGLYSGVVQSGDNNRAYAFTYTISSANTWQQITVTVPGDTTGGTTAYPINNSSGLRIKFDLGSGSNYQITTGSWQAAVNKTGAAGTVGWAQTAGATFYITGVQLERGTVATPFEYRNYQQELAMCMRYYETNYPAGVAPGATDATNPTYLYIEGITVQTHTGQQYVQYKVVKRASATVSLYSANNGQIGTVYDYNGTSNRVAATQFAGPWSFVGYSQTLGSANNINMAFNWSASAEL
jgi:hypothetical protein